MARPAVSIPAPRRGNGDLDWLFLSVTESGDLVFAESTLGPFTLLWALSGDELTVKIQTQEDVWVGIGLEPEDGGMVNADMYVGHNDGDMKIDDCWSSGASALLQPMRHHRTPFSLQVTDNLLSIPQTEGPIRSSTVERPSKMASTSIGFDESWIQVIPKTRSSGTRPSIWFTLGVPLRHFPITDPLSEHRPKSISSARMASRVLSI